jgi:hypothetical protein
VLAVDDDDDDDDGIADSEQAVNVPGDDLVEVVVQADGAATPVQVTPLPGLRLLRNGRPLPTPLTLPVGELPAAIGVQATRPAVGGQPLSLLVTRGGTAKRITVHAVELALLDGHNQPLRPATFALGLSHRVTNDRTLPRSNGHEVKSGDLHDVRVQIVDTTARGKHLKARLQAVTATGQVRHAVELALERPRADMPFRSRFVRLVGDEVDRAARGVAGQVLQVALRDRVQIVYTTDEGVMRHGLRVGRPGDEQGPTTARQARLRVVVLRAYPGGPPVVGVDDASALRILRDEVAIANEIWLQCELTFGPPSEVAVQILDPPGPTLLSIADGDGLPARGGAVSLRADGQPIGPVEIPVGTSPAGTALLIAAAARKLDFDPLVTINPAAVFGAGPSADILIRRRNGALAHLEPVQGVPLTTDGQQRVRIGEVDLGDGLEEFDNMTAQSGTLEERALIKSLSDDDPSTIDLFIVNRFTHGTRQGEAFIAASSGPIVNSVVLDRNGLRQRQTAWTMAHELGHVLLNQPLHPDNVGADVPTLLMDSDNNRGTVHGPKRLSEAECQRMRHESETRARPPVIEPYDARPSVRRDRP